MPDETTGFEPEPGPGLFPELDQAAREAASVNAETEQATESIALAVAKSQIASQVNPGINVTTALVMTVERLLAEASDPGRVTVRREDLKTILAAAHGLAPAGPFNRLAAALGLVQP